MTQYAYSVVRCVPNPAAGEFVNIGIIVTSDDGGDVAIFQATNDIHASRLATPFTIAAAREFMTDLMDKKLNFARLHDLYASRRNMVQFSEPLPVDCATAQEGACMLRRYVIIEETSHGPT